MVALPAFTFIECVCRKVKKLSEIARDFLLCQNLRLSSFKKPTKIWRNLEGKLEGSNDWPDAAFSIVFLWFLDLMNNFVMHCQIWPLAKTCFLDQKWLLPLWKFSENSHLDVYWHPRCSLNRVFRISAHPSTYSFWAFKPVYTKAQG